MNWLDLHMHSNRSNDADMTPKDLVCLCQKAGLKAISLTDHNSVKGVLEAQEAGREIGVEVIPGVELDCTYKTYNLHILGYGIDVPNETINRIEKSVYEQELKASTIIMKKIKELGIYFEEDKALALSSDGVITGEMIAEVAMEDSRNVDNPLMIPYFEGGSRSDNPYVNFYWDFCSQGKKAYVPMHFISLEEAIQLIKESNGVPVLAHPEKNIGLDEDIFSEIVKCGVCGVEVYSSYHDDKMIRYYEGLAHKYKVFMTPGSDFHGKIKPSIHLGNIVGQGDDQQMYDILIKCIQSKGDLC